MTMTPPLLDFEKSPKPLNRKKNKRLINLGECLGNNLDSPRVVIERQESAESGNVDGVGEVD